MTQCCCRPRFHYDSNLTLLILQDYKNLDLLRACNQVAVSFKSGSGGHRLKNHLTIPAATARMSSKYHITN